MTKISDDTKARLLARKFLSGAVRGWRLAALFTLAAGLAGPCLGLSAALPPDHLPLYEYGLVTIAARLPHYPGSDEYQNYFFPLPYLVYRGEVVRANRDGVRGIFWRNDHFESDISLSGNPPAGDNRAREGMAELAATGEIGPALNYYFFEYGERDSLFLQASLRAAFSVDIDGGPEVGHEGYVSDFSLIYRDSRLFRAEKVRFHLSAGVRFADAALHSYFYEVRPAEARPDRKPYTAGGGYGGLQLSTSVVKELTARLSVSCFGRWLHVDGAAYDDSPLVDTTDNVVLGAMLVWKIGESEILEK